MSKLCLEYQLKERITKPYSVLKPIKKEPFLSINEFLFGKKSEDFHCKFDLAPKSIRQNKVMYNPVPVARNNCFLKRNYSIPELNYPLIKKDIKPEVSEIDKLKQKIEDISILIYGIARKKDIQSLEAKTTNYIDTKISGLKNEIFKALNSDKDISIMSMNTDISKDANKIESIKQMNSSNLIKVCKRIDDINNQLKDTNDKLIKHQKEHHDSIIEIQNNIKEYFNSQKIAFSQLKTSCDKILTTKDLVLKQFAHLSMQIEINKKKILSKIALICANPNSEIYLKKRDIKDIESKHNLSSIKKLTKSIEINSDIHETSLKAIRNNENSLINCRSIMEGISMSFSSEDEKLLIPLIKENFSDNKPIERSVIKDRIFECKREKKNSKEDDTEGLDDSFLSAKGENSFVSCREIDEMK